MFEVFGIKIIVENLIESQFTKNFPHSIETASLLIITINKITR